MKRNGITTSNASPRSGMDPKKNMSSSSKSSNVCYIFRRRGQGSGHGRGLGRGISGRGLGRGISARGLGRGISVPRGEGMALVPLLSLAFMLLLLVLEMFLFFKVSAVGAAVTELSEKRQETPASAKNVSGNGSESVAELLSSSFSMHNDDVTASSSSSSVLVEEESDFVDATSAERRGKDMIADDEEERLTDHIDDGMYEPFASDPSCGSSSTYGGQQHEQTERLQSPSCWEPPPSTVEYVNVVETTVVDSQTASEIEQQGGDIPGTCSSESCVDDGDDDKLNKKKKVLLKRKTKRVDKHWGSDDNILALREALRNSGRRSRGGSTGYDSHRRRRFSSSSSSSFSAKVNSTSRTSSYTEDGNRRPPIFLMPGLASTRLVAWTHKQCPGLSSDIRVQDYVWMKIAKLVEMAGTLDTGCWKDCMKLGPHQTDGHHYDESSFSNAVNEDERGDWSGVGGVGCKIRPDEGLDAISSLAPGSITSNVLVGGTNTLYAWLIQWLADNLGYDVSSLVGLPYDWRLSPDVMEDRDGFLTLTQKRIEAAVETNGAPGIIVAHSMGNAVFRYFLEWLRDKFRVEAYERYKTAQERRRLQRVYDVKRREAKAKAQAAAAQVQFVTKAEANMEAASSDQEKKESSSSESEGGNLPANPLVPPPHMSGWLGVGGGIFSYQLLSSEVRNRIDDLWRYYVSGEGEAGGVDDRSEGADGAGQAEVQQQQKGEVGSVAKVKETNLMEDGEDRKNKKIYSRQHVEEEEDKLWQLAEMEGDITWLNWLERHLWTYVGLSAPLLGATGPLRAVLSGESMGLPMSEAMARDMEMSFGSTHTANPISTKMGFCDNDLEKTKSKASSPSPSPPSDADDVGKNNNDNSKSNRANLGCLDELLHGIEESVFSGSDNGEKDIKDKKDEKNKDPWKDFKALRAILKDRVDWDTAYAPITVIIQRCKKKVQGKDVRQPQQTCSSEYNTTEIRFSPLDIQSGEVFTQFGRIWREKNNPLLTKRQQLEETFWSSPFPNVLNTTWDRPPIKHIIMAYGVDVPTENGYVYKKIVWLDDDDDEKKKDHQDQDRVADNNRENENNIGSDDETDVEGRGRPAASASASTSTSDNNEHKNVDEDVYDGLPTLVSAMWEEQSGRLMVESIGSSPTSIADSVWKRRGSTKQPFDYDGKTSQKCNGNDKGRRDGGDEGPDDLGQGKEVGQGILHHSGDGTIPYLSLSWAHTWLLHGTRAMRRPPRVGGLSSFSSSLSSSSEESMSHLGTGGTNNSKTNNSNNKNALDAIQFSYRPKGGMKWISGKANDDTDSTDNGGSNKDDKDTGTSHPHGTKYKPEMRRFYSTGKSRTTGMEYTTAVIEAIGVEHKETTRNYDILAAAFTDILQYMHDDLGLI